MRAVLVACAASVACAACTMGPDYVRPKVDAPAAFRFEVKTATDTVNTEWWKQFSDPVLDAMIELRTFIVPAVPDEENGAK